jgi:hypothetical protein
MENKKDAQNSEEKKDKLKSAVNSLRMQKKKLAETVYEARKKMIAGLINVIKKVK